MCSYGRQTKVKKRHILFVSATLEAGNGGIARVGRMSARALIETGFSVSLLSYLDRENIYIAGRPVSSTRASKPAFMALRTAKLISHSHAIYDFVGLARGHTLFPKRRPYCVWIHGEEIWENLRPEHERALRSANLVLANSQYTLRRFEMLHGPLTQSRVCWLGTEYDPQFRRQARSRPTVLVLGRMERSEPGKGHAELIDCWPDVVRRVPNARLLVVGRGTALEDFKRRASLSPSAGNIEFTGYVPEAQIEGMWDAADVLALPSRQEGFGIVYAEAMGRGIPIIASINDAGGEINKDGLSGFNVDLSQRDQIVDRISCLLQQPDLALRLGSQGRKHWEDNFTYERFRSRFVRSLSDFLSP